MGWKPEEAKRWALTAHRSINHLRPHSDEPYEVHLEEVVALVESVPHTPRMVAGAWLHDVVDDVPGVTVQMLAVEFGWAVATLVDALSDHEKGLGNRTQRKAAERVRIDGADWETQTVRVADIISNVRTIAQRNPEFARVYVPEKAALLEVLTKADPDLLATARAVVRDAQAQLSTATGGCMSKLTAAQTRVMSWLGKGWTGRPAYGAVIEVNGMRICNVDTMMALSRLGLVGKDKDGQWAATESGKNLVAQEGI